MSDNLFMDPERCPDEAAVEAALGPGFAWYESICEAADEFEQEWKFYGKKYGWKLKVHDYVKTLCELTIGGQGLRIGLALREKELLALRADAGLAALLGGLLAAERAAEGWGVRFAVDGPERAEQTVALIAAVAPHRE